MSEDIIPRESLRYARTGYFAMRPPTEGPAQCLLLALHGWGQSARWFLRQFHALEPTPIFTAAPQGPHQFYLDVGSKKVGFNWLTAFEKEDNIADANRFFDAVITEAQARASGGELPLYVLGFSQGSAMAWRYAVHAHARVTGVISCCADLPPDVAAALPQLEHRRTLLVYGTDDGIIPQESIEAAQQTLRDLKWQHDVLEFEGGHELNAPTIHEIGQWITGTLPQ